MGLVGGPHLTGDRRKGVMSKIVRFTITGHAPDTDAPSVEDFLDQIRDYLDILRGVEEAVAGAPGSAIVWRVVEASRNSPVMFGVEAFPRHYATNIDQRAALVVGETARGLAAIKSRPERPTFFTNEVMRKARKVAERVTNGIGRTKADFGPNLPADELTQAIAQRVIRNVDTALAGPIKPYQEIGSIEGYLTGVELDGFGRRVAYVRERITGETVKCVIPKSAPQLAVDLSTKLIGDVWRRIRILVSGRIYYTGPGKIDHIDATNARFLLTRAELPQIDDVIDENFTNGMRSEEYLERLRDGTLPQ